MSFKGFYWSLGPNQSYKRTSSEKAMALPANQQNLTICPNHRYNSMDMMFLVPTHELKEPHFYLLPCEGSDVQPPSAVFEEWLQTTAPTVAEEHFLQTLSSNLSFNSSLSLIGLTE